MINLHSNMFLLFEHTASTNVREKQIYIPICFYYLKCAVLDILDPIQFTFQYVSIIFLSPSWQVFLEKDLHSNMFLLFARVLVAILLTSIIYIPICFYYFGKQDGGLCVKHIYIPICFYYLKSLEIFTPPLLIYIPICFYYFN